MPQHNFLHREPQQFGLVAFTEVAPDASEPIRRVFGNYGIVMSFDWAHRAGVQRVMYIEPDGPVTEGLIQLFAAGYDDVSAKIRHPDDAFWNMAYENKNVAAGVAGSSLWASLLTLWEYMEPAKYSYQREWRLVNPDPNYGLATNRREAIRNIDPPENWAKVVNVVPFKPADVEGIVLPKEANREVANILPQGFKNTRIWNWG
jgi:hypothetical protein